MKRRLLWCCILILQYTCVQAQFDANSVYNPSKVTDLNAYKASDALRLMDDYKLLLEDQLNNRAEISALKAANIRQELIAKYHYIKEQIELQRYLFFRNGNVLPAYKDLVEVSTADGKINGITIIQNVVNAISDEEIVKIFTADSLLKIEYPITYQGLKSGFIKFMDQAKRPFVMMQIKRIDFPYLVSVTGAVEERKKYNNVLFNFIKGVDLIPKYHGLLNSFIEIEKKNVPSGSLDKLIEFREQFIIQFKKIYDAK